MATCCDKPWRPDTLVDKVSIGIDGFGGCEGIHVERCEKCDRLWMTYLMEDWVKYSNRWYRVEVSEVPEPTDARSIIEGAAYCYAGGGYHRPNDETGEPLYLADGTERRVMGFRWNAPILMM